jgi:hypothetical protein
MIDKKISVSEQVANLSTEAQLFYTWGIPHADDCGLLPRSPRQLKAIVFPMKESIPQIEMENILQSLMNENLATEWEYNGVLYFRYLNFTKYQTLKRDRMPNTLFQMPEKIKKPSEAWDYLETLGFHLEDNDVQVEKEGKGREGKRREVKIRKEKVYGELGKVRLMDGEYEKLVEKLGEKNTNILIGELDTYVASRGKHYASHYATILNWASRRVQQHVEKENKGKKII